MNNTSTSPPKKNIFVFDKNRCVGCEACLIACVNENEYSSVEFWRKISNSNPRHLPDLPLFYLSLACNHCEEAPCMKSCPTQAFHFDKNSGAVIHDQESCIGCKYCIWTCPFDTPRFSYESGLIEKCNFCNHRLAEGLKPACTNLCPTGALNFQQEEIGAEKKVAASYLARKLGASIRFIELENPNPPKIDTALFEDQQKSPSDNSANTRITAIKEWPLLVFTLLSSIMVGAYEGIQGLPYENIFKWIISGMAVFAGLLSLLHLGKKNRAWQAITNIEKSWLSREILFFIFFVVSIYIDFFIFDIPDIIPTINGVLLLTSIDMIYVPLMGRWKIKVHSAQTLFIALSIWLILSQYLLVFLFVNIIRMALCFMRKKAALKSPISIIRIGLLAFGFGLIFLTYAYWLGVALIVLGELLDRIGFYNELEVYKDDFIG